MAKQKRNARPVDGPASRPFGQPNVDSELTWYYRADENTVGVSRGGVTPGLTVVADIFTDGYIVSDVSKFSPVGKRIFWNFTAAHKMKYQDLPWWFQVDAQKWRPRLGAMLGINVRVDL